MDKYEHFTREELISLISEFKARIDTGTRTANAVSPKFPVFGPRERREFENSPWPIRIFDRRTLKYLAVNDAALKLYGYTREEFLRLTPLDTRHPEEHSDSHTTLLEPSGYLMHFGPRRHVKRSGEIMIVEIITQDILYDGREARLSLTMDVTERERVRERLRRREQEFSALVEHAPDVIARFDRDLRYVYVNPAVSSVMGIPRNVFIGRTSSEVGVPPALNALWERKLRSTLETGEEGRLEFECPCHDGVRHFEARIVPESGPDGAIESVLAVAHDITERKQNEFTLQRTAAIAKLLAALARAANEAATPEAAMAACLDCVCRHGGWLLGRVALFGEGGPGNVPPRSIWYAPDRDRFAEFIHCTNGRVHGRVGPFLGRVLREQTAVWIEDMRREPDFGRERLAITHGLRSAFAFPIIVRGNVVALIEVFREDAPRDPLMMEAAQAIASQLARIIEREWAQESNARLAAIVESSQDAIISRKLDGTILTWNPGAEQLFGYTAAEATGRSIALIIPPEERLAMVARQTLLTQGGTIPIVETVRMAKGERRIPVSVSVSPIRENGGPIRVISTIIRDITQRKQAEQALNESEARLELAIESAGLGMWDWNVRTGETRRHRRWYQMLGYSPQEIPDRMSAWRELIHPDDWPGVERRMDDYFRGTMAHYTIEYRMKSKTGKWLWMQSIGSAAERDSDGKPLRMIGFIQDLTERKLAEEERLSRAIRQRDALVREVHHRIKNNLQGVIGLLRQSAAGLPESRTHIDRAISQLQTIAVVHGLRGHITTRSVLLRDMVPAIAKAVEGATTVPVNVTIAADQNLRVQAIEDELVPIALVLNELIMNAAKRAAAAADSGSVDIRLSIIAGAAKITISNPGALPRDFAFAKSRGIGTGLELVRSLLPQRGMEIEFSQSNDRVEVTVALSQPIVGPHADATPDLMRVAS